MSRSEANGIPMTAHNYLAADWGWRHVRREWVMEDMENFISLMKREKGRKKKSKHASEPYPAEFSGDQNMSRMKKGCNIQPIMEQAHTHKADQVDENKGPLELKRKKAQEKQEGKWAKMRPSTGDIQNKKPSKKKQGQTSKKKNLTTKLIAARRKGKKDAEEDKANTSLRDKTTAEENSESSSKLNKINRYGNQITEEYESKNESRKEEEYNITGISIGDSGIQNMNRLFLTDLGDMSAKEIWEASKSLGAMFEGDENEIIQKIQQMEERDRIEWSRTLALGGWK
ncbi:hypothetical protein Ancab_009020 [Ancistrocladus abbreviatus]